jgi:hypothetical protein
MPLLYRLTGVSRNWLTPAKFDDGVEVFLDFPAAHAQDGAVEEDVFTAGEFGVKAGADFEEAADSAVEADFAVGRFGDAAEDFEQGAFAGAVAADDAENLALFHFKIDIAQGPEGLGFLPLERIFHPGEKSLGKRGMILLVVEDGVRLGEAADGDGGVDWFMGDVEVYSIPSHYLTLHGPSPFLAGGGAAGQ